MRRVININENWEFIKENIVEEVNLPHCWNGVDGQGASDKYYRGRCVYRKTVPGYGGKVFVEINGASIVCEVFVNGAFVGRHENGYSMFRYDITDYLRENKNTLEIAVDNSANEFIYPEMADFTFYGGLYRDVNIICEVPESRFALLDKSRCGVYITSRTDGTVFVKSVVEGETENLVKEYAILDAEGNEVASAVSDKDIAKIEIENPVIWNGMQNPYLYTLVAKLVKDGEVIDEVSDRFGIRRFYFDNEKGFFLNGEHLKLRGVSRHQDWKDIGYALTEKEHATDTELIKEVGANSIRLAHYQHDSKFYDMCDETGFLVWAEIPVISRFSKKKQPQAKLMLEELIRQNYNHPSIFCWGIANEISIAGGGGTLCKGIEELNSIAHKLDETRPTACAQVTFSSSTNPLNDIPDILGYNQYYGWYVQTVNEIDKWLDRFHEERPELKMSITEYGAEAVTTLHSVNPVQGDYTEEYQSLFHEHYIRAINERDWLWGSYVWNMFDFGSAIRNEGGVRGRNNKGLVTIDRKIKKDAFYAYKAYWSDEEFVHIAGERFVDRPVGEQKIKVYSNCNKLTLSVNGEKTELSGEKIYEVDAVINEGENVIVAKSGKLTHKIIINGTDIPNPEYSLGEGQQSFVRNWFDANDEIDPDKLSLNDTLGDILENPNVKTLIKNQTGKEINIPGMKHIGKIPLKPIAKLAQKSKKASDYVNLANQFLQTIDKK